MQLAQSSTSIPAQLEQLVEALHALQLHSYGKRYTDMWGSVEADQLIAHWAHGLLGYTAREIKRGMAALEAKDWPPTLPEFKKLCRPPVSETLAYYEALAGVQARAAGEAGTWSHPAIYWAAMPLAFDLGAQTYSQIKARWERALDEQMSRGEWPAIPQPMVALPAPGKAELSKENATKMMRELGAVGIIKNPQNVQDGKRWARKILDRLERKDKTLLLIQIKFAKTAMGIDEATT